MAQPQSNPVYINDAGLLSQFIQEFRTEADSFYFKHGKLSSVETSESQGSAVSGILKYMMFCWRVSRQEQKLIFFELDDLEEWLMQRGYSMILVESICNNSMRYISVLEVVFDQLIEYFIGVNLSAFTNVPHVSITFDKYEANNDNGKPSALTRYYELNLVPPRKVREDPIPLRMVRANSIGRLITVNAIVTRVTEVRPMVIVATYSCDRCGIEVYQTVNSQTYNPLRECPSKVCQQNTGSGILQFQTRASKFIKYQEIRLQELASQVQVGHIPHTNRVKLFGELTRSCSPGDIINIHAIFLPIANQGFKAIKFGLIAGTYLMGQGVEQHKIRHSPQENYLNSISSIPKELAAKIDEFVKSNCESRYNFLARSIAPEIFGHEDVKKSLLLQMVGGSTQIMDDGMKIRGDINICLMGDPGVAKSQLLKHISTIAPRAVYTSGKGSTGVGLTAAILKDPNTNEFVLEGGSLAMADMGICCIDEFDKMDDCDRTAIHEVMEQQTISISKAGINTILNARTAILAAANPAWGRYNVKRSPAENINLPTSLLSRFDLLFIILDKPDSDHDLHLAMHVIHVHRFGEHPVSSTFRPLEADFIRAYVLMAKGYRPYVPEDVQDFIVNAYLEMRQEQDLCGEEYFCTTARSLLAILRLSQALCKLRFSTKISKMDIEESIRLINNSRNTIFDEKATSLSKQKPIDDVSSIYNIIRNFAKNNKNEILYDEIAPIILLKGYSEDLLNKVLDIYDQLGGVWTISSNRRLITIIS